MHNTSKYSVNDTHAIDSGLKRCSLGMKTTQSSNSKWVSIDRPNAKIIMRSPPSNRNNVFQTMTNATNESNPYCNTFVNEQQQLDQNQSIFNQSKQYAFPPYGQRNLHSIQIEEKLLNRNFSKKYNNSDMASIHYHPVRALNHYSNTNYNNNNVNIKNNGEDDEDVQSPRWIRVTEDQQFTVEHQPLLLLDANNSYSNTTDQHYEHYYSYYYDRQPIRKQLISTGRKLPDTLMATRKNNQKIDAKNHRTVTTSSISSDNHKKQNEPLPIHDHQNVLKENNNIIGSPTDDWLAKMNGADLLGLTSEFMDIKDVDAYEDELNLMYGTGGKLLRSKRKLQKCAKSDVIPCNGNNNNNNSWFHDEKACGDTVAYNKNTEYKKLPATPQKSSGKKYSPLPHKVLHYGNQSPRLHRLSPHHNVRSKSPALTIQNKPISHRSPADGTNKKDPKTDCYTSVIKSFTPGTTPILGVKGKRLSTQNIKREQGGATHLTETDSADSDDNVGDDDDDIDNDIDDLDNVSGANDSSDTDDTSDSEDGYRVYAYKLTHSLERISFAQSNLSSEATEDDLQSPQSVLVPSLFAHVPPYLAFSSNKQKGPDVPAELHRVLKWRVTNVMPKVVRCILANSGMRLLKKTNDWMGIWGKHMKSPCFKTIRTYQKINHLPGSFKIGRKDSCWKNLLKQMNKHGKKEFGFMPKTYIIPHDLNLLRKHWPKYAQRNVKWIIKPPASARGTGIRVVDRWAQIPKRKPLIVQKYIERPLLINGSKFDLRLYVLVTSVNPLRVFMYHNGLARFASVKYSDRSDTLNDRCMHLTNYSINKFSSNYAKNEDVNACHGHKWTIKSLWSYLANRGVRTDCLWEALRNLVLRTILAGEQSINNMIRMNMESKYSCFELFGFDVLLDSDLIPWLLEVNISPSLHSELPLDAHVKAPLVQGVLNTALFQVPPKLSHEAQKQIMSQLQLPAGALCYDKRLYINYLSRTEKIKHTTFTRKSLEDRDEYINSILDNLTPDDIRCLIVAEDELARCTPLERIFPTNQTYKYLKYTDSPRYYNRLLDAWETRYANNRAKGIALLQKYCEDKYHLEVPPSPAKKLIKHRTRTLIMPRTMWTHLRTPTTTSIKTSKRILQIHWKRRNFQRNSNKLNKNPLNSYAPTSSSILSSSSSSSSLYESVDYNEGEKN